MHPNTITPPVAAKLEPGDLVTETEAAAILGVAVQSLRNWRWKGRGGPRFRKVGARLVRYHRADLAAFIAGDATKDAAA
ncbi:MAG: helix-turn-helix transcriptional regulator [Rhodanobacteraceae bacterium]